MYTSTDYPPSEEIFLHNENSYQATWPLTLFFSCVTPPDTLGSTPLADTRRVLGMALAATSYTPIPEPSYGIFRM